MNDVTFVRHAMKSHAALGQRQQSHLDHPFFGCLICQRYWWVQCPIGHGPPPIFYWSDIESNRAPWYLRGRCDRMSDVCAAPHIARFCQSSNYFCRPSQTILKHIWRYWIGSPATFWSIRQCHSVTLTYHCGPTMCVAVAVASIFRSIHLSGLGSIVRCHHYRYRHHQTSPLGRAVVIWWASSVAIRKYRIAALTTHWDRTNGVNVSRRQIPMNCRARNRPSNVTNAVGVVNDRTNCCRCRFAIVRWVVAVHLCNQSPWCSLVVTMYVVVVVVSPWPRLPHEMHYWCYCYWHLRSQSQRSSVQWNHCNHFCAIAIVDGNIVWLNSFVALAKLGALFVQSLCPCWLRAVHRLAPFVWFQRNRHWFDGRTFRVDSFDQRQCWLWLLLLSIWSHQSGEVDRVIRAVDDASAPTNLYTIALVSMLPHDIAYCKCTRAFDQHLLPMPSKPHNYCVQTPLVLLLYKRNNNPTAMRFYRERMRPMRLYYRYPTVRRPEWTLTNGTLPHKIDEINSMKSMWFGGECSTWMKTQRISSLCSASGATQYPMCQRCVPNTETKQRGWDPSECVCVC